MDCVRTSTDKVRGEEYVAKYNSIQSLQNSVPERCEQECVSTPTCVAWKSTPTGCYISEELIGPYSQRKLAGEDVYSGLMECKSQWNALKSVLGLVLLIFVIVGLAYFLNIFVPRTRRRGTTILPRFFLK